MAVLSVQGPMVADDLRICLTSMKLRAWNTTWQYDDHRKLMQSKGDAETITI